jgi:ABC-type transport system involved in multi-copper enzyme maturation permease subunit
MTVSIEVNPAAWTRRGRQPSPLLAVFSWELTHLLRDHRTWLLAAGVVVITTLVVWQMKVAALLLSDLTLTRANVSVNSPWGLLLVLPSPLLYLFGALVPFIFTSQLSRELKLRTHELVMSCAMPGWAFVAGRYLAGLVVSLGMAVLLLISLLATGLALQVWEAQPAPLIGPALALWAVIILPALFLVAGLSAGLAAWQPRWAGLIRVMLLLLWFIAPLFIRLPAYSTPWYTAWDPTATLMPQAFDREYRDTYYSTTRFVLDNAAVQQTARRVAQKMPDLWPWLLPQVFFSVLGLGLAGLAAWRFKRFGNCLR